MELFLSDFNTGADTTLVVIHALEACQDGDTLHLGGGTWVFDEKFATADSYYLPRYSDLPKLYTFYVQGKKNLTIDGDGAHLIFKDNISAFGFFECDNITLKNFTVDYDYPCFFQAKIIESAEDHFAVEIDQEKFPCLFDPKEKKLSFFARGEDKPCLFLEAMLANEYDAEGRFGLNSPDYFLCVGGKPHEVYSNMSALFDVAQEGNILRFTHVGGREMPCHHVGSHLMLTNHERRNNDLYFYRCKNISLSNIELYSSPSFGVIALLCENILIDNVNTRPKPGTTRKLAATADMFHFVNTKGFVKIENSTVCNINDDCVNVHSLYTRVLSKIGPNKLLVDCPYLAKKILNLYQKGDVIQAVDPCDFSRKGKGHVVLSSVFRGRYCLEITFEDSIEQINEEDFLTAIEYEPDLYISGCRFGNNRGRGILPQTSGSIRIENNVIYNSGSGIKFGGTSKTYMEGSPARQIAVLNNCFDDCGYRGKNMIDCSAQMLETDHILYGKLVLKDNVMKATYGQTLADLCLFDSVEIKNNKVIGEAGDEPWKVDRCTSVIIE